MSIFSKLFRRQNEVSELTTIKLKCPYCKSSNTISDDGWYLCKKCNTPFNSSEIPHNKESRDHLFWVPLVRLVGKLSAIDGDCDATEEQKLKTFIDDTFYRDPNNNYLPGLLKEIFNRVQEESNKSAEKEINQLNNLISLTQNEKYHIIQLLMEVALSDSIYHPHEQELLTSLVKTWGCEFLEDGCTPTLQHYLHLNNWAQLSSTTYEPITLEIATVLMAQKSVSPEVVIICKRVIHAMTVQEWTEEELKETFIAMVKEEFSNRETPIPYVCAQSIKIKKALFVPDILVPLQKQIPIFINSTHKVPETPLIIPIVIKLSIGGKATIKQKKYQIDICPHTHSDIKQGVETLKKMIRELFFTSQNHFVTAFSLPKHTTTNFITAPISIDKHLRINSVYQKEAHEIQSIMKEYQANSLTSPQLSSALMQYYAIISNDGHLLANVAAEQQSIQAELNAQHYSAAILHCGRCAEAVVYNLKAAWDISLKREAFQSLLETERKWHELLNLLSSEKLANARTREDKLFKWLGEFNHSFYFLVKRWEEYDDNKEKDSKSDASSEDSKVSDLILLKSIEHKLKSQISHEEISTKGPQVAILIKQLETTWKDSIKIKRDRAAHAPLNQAVASSHSFTITEYEEVEEGLISFISTVVELYNVVNPLEYRPEPKRTTQE